MKFDRMQRRDVLKLAALGSGGLMLGAGFSAYADDHGMEKVDPESGQAKSLNYVHDASEAKGHAQFKEGSICSNCALWTGGESEWGGCGIFPGKQVAAAGWCAAWAPAG